MYERREYIVGNKKFCQLDTIMFTAVGSQDCRGKWGVSYSPILTRLIQEAGRFCERFASDLFIDWKGVEEWMNDPTERRVWMFGFRRNGVDHDAYVLTGHNEREYRSLWILECECDGENITMMLWESNIHPYKINPLIY